MRAALHVPVDRPRSTGSYLLRPDAEREAARIDPGAGTVREDGVERGVQALEKGRIAIPIPLSSRYSSPTSSMPACSGP